jgi:YebC/PmpR family DNA-binding regulatory protein
MFARWNKMAKVFTRISKDIVIAVKAGGPDPHTNPALRRQIQNARAANMPKDKIDAAIKRATTTGGENYEQVLYEGYAPHGIALLVETATDNVTRTVANVRAAFAKNGGNMGTSGSVSFLFKHMGVFKLDPKTVPDQDALELELIDHGLEELGEGQGETQQNGQPGEKQLIIRCNFADFGTLQAALEAKKLTPISAESEYIPLNVLDLPEDKVKDVMVIVERLEEDDDVQRVSHNLA